MKPTHFAIIMLRVTALGFFANIAFDATHLPQYMATMYTARTAAWLAIYRMETNMLLLRITLNFFFGLLCFSGTRPLVNALVRGLERDDERA